MKNTSLVIAAVCAAFALAASAADKPKEKKELTPQQQRMSECSTKSKGMKGEEHKKFMSECLKGETPMAVAGKETQQEKMKTCNADAKTKNLKGDERKKFMSSCLKG